MLWQHFGLTRDQVWNDLTMEQVELRIYQAEKLEAERTHALAESTALSLAKVLVKIRG